MRVNGISSYNYRPKNQVNFGIVLDKKAEEIIEKNSSCGCIPYNLKKTKFFIFWSEKGKLKAKTDDDLFIKKDLDYMLERVKSDPKRFNFDNPVETLDNFRWRADTLMEYQDPDPNDPDACDEETKKQIADAIREAGKEFEYDADREIEARVWREAQGFWY